MFSWDDFPNHRISPAIHSDLRHADIVRQLDAFRAAFPDKVSIRRLGESVEGRSVALLTLGNGERTVLAWSQMHGNEPTHTAAALDLVNFLLTSPEHPTAKAILAGCTLNLILMLNPDGAERWTRRNAQDIDINRDALHMQTPEGLILRDVVLDLQPEFALNLHNHRPHTTVGSSQKPASFSLLVPPIDAAETDTENVLKAKRIASYLAETVAQHCPGPMSRYNADYMPRCFGEWVQQQGAATITIEAGGWTTVAAEPLVQLHFFGLVACLESIATGSFLEVSPNVYESLPRTGEHDLFDKLLRGVSIFNGLGQPSFRADLGINFQQTLPTTLGGTIVDLGDLHVTDGKRSVDATDLACLPGRIAWLADFNPTALANQQTVLDLLDSGATTLLGQVDLSDERQVAELALVSENYSSPLNIGFLAKLTEWTPEIIERLVKAISQGILGVLAEGLSGEMKLYLSLFNFPIVSENTLPRADDPTLTLTECASQTQQCARMLGLDGRGSIQLGSAADLILFRKGNVLNGSLLLDRCDLQRVIVGGNVVFEAGELVDQTPGQKLRSSLARP